MPDVTEQEVWEGDGRRYHMMKVVGNGAFGVVWRAREENSSEIVAIKKVCRCGCAWPCATGVKLSGSALLCAGRPGPSIPQPRARHDEMP